MRTGIYLFIGILFGITMFKSEAASWFRIYEMFSFDSFHMYGIIGTAVITGVLFLQISKKGFTRRIFGTEIIVPIKENGFILAGLSYGSDPHIYRDIVEKKGRSVKEEICGV